MSAVESGGAGLSRLSLMSENWHNKYNAMVNTLGFSSLAGTKTVIKDLFPWVDVDYFGKFTTPSKGRHKGKEKLVPSGLTEFEQCLAAKMFMHSVPHWGKAGEFLSILHITPNYLESE